MATSCSRGPERAPEPHSAGELSRRSRERVGKGESRSEQQQIDIRDGLVWLIGCAGEIVSQGSAQNRKDLSKHGRPPHPTDMARSHNTIALNDNNRSKHRRPIMPASPGISSAVVRPCQWHRGNSTRGTRG
jgi:hypothetical protein